MAWEREYHHLDLAVGEHVIGLIDRSVVDLDGNPARYEIHLWTRSEVFEYSLGTDVVKIKLGGGDLQAHPDGHLRDSAGHIYDPRHIEKEVVARLNEHHQNLRAYAKRHSIPELKPPVKPGNSR